MKARTEPDVERLGADAENLVDAGPGGALELLREREILLGELVAIDSLRTLWRQEALRLRAELVGLRASFNTRDGLAEGALDKAKDLDREKRELELDVQETSRAIALATEALRAIAVGAADRADAANKANNALDAIELLGVVVERAAATEGPPRPSPYQRSQNARSMPRPTIPEAST